MAKLVWGDRPSSCTSLFTCLIKMKLLNPAFTLSALLLVVAMLAVSHGKIIHSVVDTDYRSLIPLSDAFGFAAGGKLTFTISNIAIYQQHKTDKLPDLKHLGFFLSPIEAETAMADLAEEETPGACILDSIKGNSLPTFSDSLIRQIIDGKSEKAEFDFTLENGGPFYLYFANCDQDTPVSFDMHIEVGDAHSMCCLAY